jgi:hypothetical protein
VRGVGKGEGETLGWEGARMGEKVEHGGKEKGGGQDCDAGLQEQNLAEFRHIVL